MKCIHVLYFMYMADHRTGFDSECSFTVCFALVFTHNRKLSIEFKPELS